MARTHVDMFEVLIFASYWSTVIYGTCLCCPEKDSLGDTQEALPIYIGGPESDQHELPLVARTHVDMFEVLIFASYWSTVMYGTCLCCPEKDSLGDTQEALPLYIVGPK